MRYLGTAIGVILLTILASYIFPYIAPKENGTSIRSLQKGDVCDCQVFLLVPPDGVRLTDTSYGFTDWDKKASIKVGSTAQFVGHNVSNGLGLPFIIWRFHYTGETTTEDPNSDYYIRKGVITKIVEKTKK